MACSLCFSDSETEGLAFEATDLKCTSLMQGGFLDWPRSFFKTSLIAASWESDNKAWRSAPLNPSVMEAIVARLTSLASGSCDNTKQLFHILENYHAVELYWLSWVVEKHRRLGVTMKLRRYNL